VRREFGLDVRRLVQLDDTHAGQGLHRMTAVGDDEHVRRHRSLAEHEQNCPQSGGNADDQQLGRSPEEGGRHIGCP